MLNVPTKTYDYQNPDEHRIAFDDPMIPYDWERKNG